MIKTVGVIGAGTMGSAMAVLFAAGGSSVRVVETDNESCRSAQEGIQELIGLCDGNNIPGIQTAMKRISFTTDMADLSDADFVIESIPELLEMKQAIFSRLDGICQETAIFASNTSSLKITDLSQLVSPARRSRMLITQWIHPGIVVPLVEITNYGGVSEETVRKVEKLYLGIGKRTIRVQREIQGLVASRINQAIYREAFSLIARGIVTREDMDAAFVYGTGLCMAAAGPCVAADMSGLDICLSNATRILPNLCSDASPSPLLGEYVACNRCGLKSGAGFYNYADRDRTECVRDYIRRLTRMI
jgi:3-hydroxybutyryl-CoA dehydrogenase